MAIVAAAYVDLVVVLRVVVVVTAVVVVVVVVAVAAAVVAVVDLLSFPELLCLVYHSWEGRRVNRIPASGAWELRYQFLSLRHQEIH